MAKSFSPTLRSVLNSRLKRINTPSTEIMELHFILFVLMSFFATFGSTQTTWSYGDGSRSTLSNQRGNYNNSLSPFRPFDTVSTSISTGDRNHVDPLRPFGTVPPPRTNGNLPSRPNDYGIRVTTQPSRLPGNHNRVDPLRPFGTVPPSRYNGNSPSRPIDNRYGVTTQPSPSWTGNWDNTNSYPNNGRYNSTRLYPSLNGIRN